MFNLTIKELYDLLKISGCELHVRFDYPRTDELTITWFRKDDKRFSRTFSSFEVETMRVPEGMLLYARRQAEEAFAK